MAPSKRKRTKSNEAKKSSGSKRTKSAGSKTAATSSESKSARNKGDAAETTANPNSSSLLHQLIEQLHDIAKTKTLCTQVLNKLEQTRLKDNDVDAYAVLVGVQGMTRLVSLLWFALQQQDDRKGAATQLAIASIKLANVLASILMADKSKLERMTNTGTVANSSAAVGDSSMEHHKHSVRSTLGQAVVCMTMACTLSLEHILSNFVPSAKDGLSDSLIRHCLWKGVQTLDMLLQVRSVPPMSSSSSSSSASSKNKAPTSSSTATHNSDGGWSKALNSIQDDVGTLVEHDQGLLQSMFVESVDEQLWSQKLQTFWTLLLEQYQEVRESSSATTAATTSTTSASTSITATSTDTSAKKTRRNTSKRGTSSSKLAEAFRSVFTADSSPSLDMEGSRVSLRRWASMTMVWLVEGQHRLTKGACKLLSEQQQWSRILAIPKREISTEESAPSSSKGKKRKVHSTTAPTAATNVSVEIPGVVGVVTLACGILQSVWGNGGGGVRSPGGSIEAFAIALLTTESSSAASKRTVSAFVGKRPDIRNLATVALWELIAVHQTSLQQQFTPMTILEDGELKKETASSESSTRTPRLRMVNDGHVGSVDHEHGGKTARFFPKLGDVLETVCKNVPTTAVLSKGEVESDSREILWTLVSAFILKQISAPGCFIVDVDLSKCAAQRLANYSIENFQVESYDDDEDDVDDDDDEDDGDEARDTDPRGLSKEQITQELKEIEMKMSELTPLDPPELPKPKVRGGKRKVASDDCTFGGLWTPCTRDGTPAGARTYDENKLFVFLRAFIAADNQQNRSNHVAGMISRLLEIADSCLDTRDTSASDTATGNTRRNGRKGKSTPSGEKSHWFRNSTMRTDLATQIFETLQASAGNPIHLRWVMQRYVRNGWDARHLSRVALIGAKIEKSIFADKRLGSAPNVVLVSLGLNVSERTMWNCFIGLCLTLARGDIQYSGTTASTTNHSLLQLPASRFALVKAVETYQFHEDRDWMHWPLHLPPTHHALTTTLFAGESKPTSCESEVHVAEGMLKSILTAIDDLELVTNTKWYGENMERVAPEETPLSLKDGRLLLLAVSRFSTDEQIKYLEKFVMEITRRFDKVLLDDSAFVLMKEVSGFLARCVTVAAAMVNLVGVGEPLRDFLIDDVCAIVYPPPNVERLVDMVKDEIGRKDQAHFMGLFGDWETPIVPSTSAAKYNVGETVKTEMQRLIEVSFQLGFKVANHDRCFFLFTAWNASGRQASWDDRILSHSIEGNKLTKENIIAPQLILSLRHDLCNLHRLIHGTSCDSSRVQGSLLQRAVEEHQLGEMGNKPVEILLTAATQKASMMVTLLLQKITSDGHEESLLSFALLECASVYLAFCVSMHTQTGSPFVGPRRGKTRRSPSGEDEAILVSILSEEDESDGYGSDSDDERVGTIMKLYDACNQLGVAPVHPDWLDTSCRFRRSVSPEAALENAKIAMKCLAQICEVSLKKYQSACNSVSNSVAVQLSLVSQEAGGVGTWNTDEATCEAFIEAVANVGGCHTAAVQKLLVNAECKNTSAAREAWVANVSQRIIGRIMDRNISFEGIDIADPEFRAGGEWELMMAESQLGACMKITAYDNYEALTRAERWRTVLESAVSHLAPTAALLQFSLSRGFGREPHKLASRGQISGGVDNMDASPQSKLSPSTATVMDCIQAVSVLPLISLFNRGDERLKQACASVATCFLEDAASYNNLVEIVRSKVVLENLFRTRKSSASSKQKFLIIEGLLSILENGHEVKVRLEDEEHRLSGVYLVLSGLSAATSALCIGSKVVLNKLLNMSLIEGVSLDDARFSEQVISELMAILFDGEASLAVKQKISKLLHEIASMDTQFSSHESNVLISVTKSLCGIGAPTLTTWLNACLRSTVCDDERNVQHWIASLLTCVVCRPSFRSEVKLATDLFAVIMDIVVCEKSNLSGTAQDVTFKLLCVLATRLGRLEELGNSLMGACQTGGAWKDEVELSSVLSFCQFLSELHGAAAITKESEDKQQSITTDMSNSLSGRQEQKDVPRACSFVLRSGFHAQHWYNCYTCGLVWDKGCCSLCLLLCHKGHDVAYSRHSSFFCDCGAEVATAAEENRVVCQCMKPLSRKVVQDVFDDDLNRSFIFRSSSPREEGSSDSASLLPAKGMGQKDESAIDLALRFFRSEAQSAIEDVSKPISSWSSSLFLLLKEVSESQFRSFDIASIRRKVPNALRMSLLDRCGKLLSIEKSSESLLVPLRACRSGTFSAKMSPEATTERLKRALLAKHGIRRSACAVDSRGRCMIAEPGTLLFMTLLPVVATKYLQDNDTFCSRAQMHVLGSYSVSFNIVGFKLCMQNERHLVVWGFAEVVICILTRSGDSVERILQVAVDLDPSEYDSEPILGCEWVPSSQTKFVLAHGSVAKLYDITVIQNDKVVESACYNLGSDVTLCDFALVPFAEPQHGNISKIERACRLFLLLSNGRLHSIPLSCRTFDMSASGIALPTGGVRTFQGVDPFGPGSTSRTLGEGQSLDFLSRSRILLYKCETSCVLALPVDRTGNVTGGSFEFLPHIISAEEYGLASEGYLCGPFTCWSEMGLVEKGSVFRAICVGRSSRSNQPRLLSVDFGPSASKIRAYEWPQNTSSGMGLSLCTSFDGVGVFSNPLLQGSNFTEQACVAVLTSTGAMMIFGESSIERDEIPGDSGKVGVGSETTATGLPKIQAIPTPKFPLTLFERLINVTENAGLVVGGDGVGINDGSARSKLSSKNGVQFVSPSPNGCTLTFSLQEDESKWVVAGLRALVGSNSPEAVPKRLIVQGRPITLLSGSKRWYDCPLTKDEVVQGVRNGFVSLGIGPSFEHGVSAVLDAIEVYAIDRSKVSSHIPKSLPAVDVSRKKEENHETCLVNKCTAAIRCLRTMDKVSLDLESDKAQILKALVQRTLFVDDESLRDEVLSLVENLISDQKRRQEFIDQATLSGISSYFDAVEEDLVTSADDSGNSDQSEPKWSKTVVTLLDCVHAAFEIATDRPHVYAKWTENSQGQADANSSLVCSLVSLLTDASHDGLDCTALADDTMRLLLCELAIGKGNRKGKSVYASFQHLAKLLDSPDLSFLQVFSDSIPKFLRSKVDEPSVPASIAQNIAFCCDSCGLFPITDCRYSLPDGDHDIDLCTKCYGIGKSTAMKMGADSDAPVHINGKAVGESTTLTCSLINQMKAIKIADGQSIAAQVEELMETKASLPGDVMEAQRASKLRKAIRLGQENETTKLDVLAVSDLLFGEVLEITSKKLARVDDGTNMTRINCLLKLLLRLVETVTDDIRIERARKFGSCILNRISNMIPGVLKRDQTDSKARYVLVNAFRCLSRLIGGDSHSVGDEAISQPAKGGTKGGGEKTKDKTDPRFVCKEHGVPAVRRRMSSGKDKNRRFYVCGMEKNKRCKYFKWADEVDRETSPASENYGKKMRATLWEAMEGPLIDRLCSLLEQDLGGFGSSIENEKGAIPSSTTSSSMLSAGSRTVSNVLVSQYTEENVNAEFEDGVFCAREKLFGKHMEEYLLVDSKGEVGRQFVLLENKGDIDKDLSARTIESVLELIATIAAPMTASAKTNHGVEVRWFSLLCEIISMRTNSRFRSLAKGALKRFCGGRRRLYYGVRDHYVFGFQFRKLLCLSAPCLGAALTVTEQARLCGTHWQEKPTTWKSLKAGSLLGTTDLLSEDYVSPALLKNAESIVTELTQVTKVRNGNWQQFCGLSALPDCKRPGSTTKPTCGTDLEALSHAPPIVALFWLACCLRGPNQAKVLKLVDVALGEEKPPSPSPLTSLSSQNDGASSEGDAWNENDTETDHVSPLSLGISESSPGSVLLGSEVGLTPDEVLFFVKAFLLNSRSADCRKVAADVALKLCVRMNISSLKRVITRLTEPMMNDVQILGSNSLQYLHFLEMLMKDNAEKVSQGNVIVAKRVVQSFATQMAALRENSNGCENAICFEASHQGKRYDLTPCCFCHRVKPSSFKILEAQSGRGRQSRATTNTVDSPPVANAKKNRQIWQPEQVRPYVRGRLDGQIEGSTSDEFCTFVQLKCRLAISEIHLTVNDPRGRYVKTILVYYTPRQVQDIAELKAKSFAERWEVCATLRLSRGMTKVTCVLDIPVVAANLRFEYKEFYERPGGSHGPDGNLVIHCPRCTRVVNNAHGVCGNCGESAYQCRKCRHINYDREDAFLCVECGYCSSGGFCYELTSGIATNVVAITDDESYELSLRLLSMSKKLCEELKDALRHRAHAMQSRKRTREQSDELLEYPPALRRALSGQLPQLEDATPESLSSSSRRDENELRTASAANRARSFLRLARSLRNDSTRRDLVARDAILGVGVRDISLEDLEEVDSFINISTSDAGIRDSDPLSRLVASIRRSDRDLSRESTNQRRSTSRGDANSGAGALRSDVKSEKTIGEECQKLYHLMRESEREAVDLQLRIDAWHRLERDLLASVGDPLDDSCDYQPTKCSRCCAPVTHQLLSIVSAFFDKQEDISLVESAITPCFIQALFLEPQQAPKELIEAKRDIIGSLAKQSQYAAQQILHELRCGLQAARGADEMCNSILGRLITEAEDFEWSQGFVDLATSALESM